MADNDDNNINSLLIGPHVAIQSACGPSRRSVEVSPAGEVLLARARDILAAIDAVPLEQLAAEPFIVYPSHFRSVVHDAVEEVCSAHGFRPSVALEVSETSTLVSFVAAGLGVSLVPESVCHMTVDGAVYRPLAAEAATVELALAWRSDNDRPLLARALDVVRRDLGRGDASGGRPPR